MIQEMNAKVKGVFKGLRYISSIFDQEPKEPEIKIGLPTDVKHVSHIGFDGPTADSTPSWMKEYKSSEEVSQPAPLGLGHPKANLEVLQASEGLQRKPSGGNNSSRDLHESHKSTRRHHSNKEKDLSERSSSSRTTSPKKEKHRNSRRRSGKDLSVNSNSNRQHQVQDDGNNGSESSPPRHLREPSKHHRRKKSKESIGFDHSVSGGSGRSRSSRSKGKRSTANEVGYENAESSPARPIRSVMNKVSSMGRSKATQVS